MNHEQKQRCVFTILTVAMIAFILGAMLATFYS